MCKPGKVLTEMYEAEKLGKKTGKGFYDWPEEGKLNIDKSEKAGLFNPMLSMAIMLNEGCRILKEGVTNSYKVIDKANMAGMNTPGPFRPGKKNYENWAKKLEDLADKTGKDYLRPIEMMKSGKFKEYK